MSDVSGRKHRQAGLSAWECEFCGNAVVTVQFDPDIGDEPDPPLPTHRTEAPPGSAAKVEVIRARLAAGAHLYHPRDNPVPERAPDARTGGEAQAECPGVRWLPARQRWEARIVVDGVRVYLGLFREWDEAERAIREAKRKGARDAEGNVPRRQRKRRGQ